MHTNEQILADIEFRGGVYVWDAEVFTVAFMAHINLTDHDVLPLTELHGVQQIALNAAHLSHAVIAQVASITGLQSLVLFNNPFSEQELGALRAIGPDVLSA
ncbi:hypothetical protein BJI69_14460 [Luteibacter rhizovicinus DSM 16549]|uniref:Uncharacterized protein n=1 Tax=Luteibacter rhizovicinus DSM 16549 TaxID=1440763 RepID=A0A0G9HG17_9GAMM|nr:hypothetical protein [Luteibacter rhizovicinus]APG04977.1 hypothetical protein BJI69_14460 [Luteibacter rhizovicinus DSM 16549]KLD68431.1 hypothetical protein Y883_01695 [Luteibacter rhizovicinus DSM 16549]